MTWADITFFRPFEFDDPTLKGSGDRMDLGFVRKLDKLRTACGFPLIIQSGYRTPEHNAEVGGVDSSAHETGHAADIRAIDSQKRFEILANAVKLGFRRIGVGNTFIHIDDSISHPQDVCWMYPASAKR